MKRLLIACVLACSLSACSGNAQPQLTPAGQVAVSATQVIKALDVIRDTAIDLNAQVPPVLSTATTRKIVSFHESAVKTILAAPSGWKQTVTAGIGQLQSDLAPIDWTRIKPYVDLVVALIGAA